MTNNNGPVDQQAVDQQAVDQQAVDQQAVDQQSASPDRTPSDAPSGDSLAGQASLDEGLDEAAMAADVAAAAGSSSELAHRLSVQLQAANDRALRAQAELENFRKRMRREVDEERRYAALPLLSELLPVIDNLDRAVETGESTPAAAELLRGVKMVQAQFLSVLERHHCRRLGAAGESFDPHQHQAIAQEPSQQYQAGAVTRVTRFGYQLHERVIRPAEVLVSTGPGAGGSPLPPAEINAPSLAE